MSATICFRTLSLGRDVEALGDTAWRRDSGCHAIHQRIGALVRNNKGESDA